MIVTVLLASMFALLGAHAAQQPSPQPNATATPTLAVTPIPIGTPSLETPSPSPSPAATSAPTAVPSNAPSPVPSLPPLKYHVVPKPSSSAPATPRILGVDVSDQIVHSGKVLAIRVTTTEDVTKVTVASNGRSGQVTMVAPGRFESMGTIPKLPPLINGINVNLVVTATNAAGVSTTTTVPIKVQR